MSFSKSALIGLASVGLIAIGAVGLQRWMVSGAAPPPMSQGGMMQSMQINSEFDYLSQMIPHHQEAIASAQILLERSQRPQMKQFAQEIIKVQSAEIKQMQAWLKAWYPGQTSSQSYQPMMSNLSTLEGKSLDQTFLEEMIMHHRAAVMMSQMLLNRNLIKHQPVRPFAEQIATSQSREIRQMEVWLKDWFGVTSMPGGMMHMH